MRTITSRYRLCLSITVLLSLTLACGLISTGNPNVAAKAAFEKWAQQVGVPYKDVSYHTIQNDGTFATVRVQASLKESKIEDWLEKQADIECRHVGSEWQCDSAFIFSLTEAEQTKQSQIASGTATVAAIKLQATATEQSRQAEATRQALAATQAVVKQNADATATANALAATATALAFIDQPVRVIEVAAGKPATASGFWNHPDLSFPPSGIVDRKTDESGNCAGGGHTTQYWLLPDRQLGWVQVDLLQNYTIVKLRWLNTYNGRCGGGRATTRFHIALLQRGSFSGEEQTVYRGTMAFSPSPTYEETVLSQPITARYVRFYVDEYYNLGGGLNELEVYADVSAP